MSAEPHALFRINQCMKTDKSHEKIEEIDFEVDFPVGISGATRHPGMDCRQPRHLGEDLLIIGKEFSGFDRTNERLDLLAVDEDGKLVIIELKRDHTGSRRPLAGHQICKLHPPRQA